MAEMIERVARAMCQLITEPGLAPEKHMATYMVLARTAIEAMREPTSAMVEAAHWLDPNHYGQGDVLIIWRAMNDAALATTTPTSPSK
jgi:hypothetical protein